MSQGLAITPGISQAPQAHTRSGPEYPRADKRWTWLLDPAMDELCQVGSVGLSRGSEGSQAAADGSATTGQLCLADDARAGAPKRLRYRPLHRRGRRSRTHRSARAL